jgi:DNA mismatch repair protein MutS2
LYDSNQKTIYIIKKKIYQRNISINKKRTAWRIMRIIEIENSKRKKATIKESKALLRRKEVIQEVTVQVEEIRKEKKEKN